MSLITPDHLSAFREGLGTRLDTSGLDNPGKAKRRVSHASTEGLCNYENRQRLAIEDSVPRNVNSFKLNRWEARVLSIQLAAIVMHEIARLT